MRLRGGRTGVRAVMTEQLELTGLMKPFDLEVWYGDRVGVLGANGAGKSHFLRLLSGQSVAHTGEWRLGARVVPGFFAQTHAHRSGRTEHRSTCSGTASPVGPASTGARDGALRRYGLADSGGAAVPDDVRRQQARFQILLLELSGATLLLLDEPTDNLDVLSAEALEDALTAFDGTVLAVTHDRWFARSFDRFLVFGADGRVYESGEPVFDETRVQRAR